LQAERSTSEPDVLDVLRWAQDRAEDRRYAIALVGTDERGASGLTWLLGNDINDGVRDGVLERMEARVGRPVIVPR
jgi:hypothetical protein